MKYKIEKKDKFKCVKTFKMDCGEKAYIKGKYYISEKKGCITNSYSDINHIMDGVKNFFKYFKLIVE